MLYYSDALILQWTSTSRPIAIVDACVRGNAFDRLEPKNCPIAGRHDGIIVVWLVINWKLSAHSARNLGFIFDEHMFSDRISALAKSCYSHIRQLRCIRPYLDHKTASTIATYIVQYKLDYCNSLYYNLPYYSQLNRLQHIQNYLARAVVRPQSLPLSTCSQIFTLAIKFFLSHTKSSTPLNLQFHNLIPVQSHRRTRSSDAVTSLVHLNPLPLWMSSYNNSSFRHASPCLWNQLPKDLRLPADHEDLSLSSDHTHVSSSFPSSPLSPSITPSLFHCMAQNSSCPQIFFSIIILPFRPPDWLHRLQLFFVFVGHVRFNFGIVC